MIIGVDIGGTKTLIGSVSATANLENDVVFPTEKDTNLQIEKIVDAVTKIPDWQTAKGVVVGAPGHIDSESRVLLACGNLPWKNFDIVKILGEKLNLPILLENDAKLAGLSEARQHGKTFGTCLYLTVSTGIGAAVIYNGSLDPGMIEAEAGHMLIKHGENDEYQSWEQFASGKALFEHYKKKAAEIHDQATWSSFIDGLLEGLLPLIAVIQPRTIIIGGSIGTYFDRYGDLLRRRIDEIELSPVVRRPEIIGAKHAEYAVIHGCYEYGQDNLA